jgi:uncharacterized membrane protein (DUF106 family)
VSDVELGIDAVAGLALVSLAITTVALLVVRRWSDQDEIARLRKVSQAHLLEFRLFQDDPTQVLQSQRALIVDQVRLMARLFRPLLILIIPMLLIMWQLDALYGRAPLRVGEAAVISVNSREVAISAPARLTVETKPVFTQATGQTSWRIRPSHETSGVVRIGSLQRRIVAGSRIAYLPEPLLDPKQISVTYPRATVYGLHWLVWFAGFSIVSAFALRRHLRTVF